MPYPEDDRLEEEPASSERRLSHVGAHGRYVAVGDLVFGKYLVEGVLGAGGMAFVLAARHIDLDQTFALKFLNAEFLGNKPIVERFMREAKAACKIRNEHVAHVHDVGFHDGAPFLVMEHLVGDDLATVLARQGPLPVQTAVEYAIQACDALAAAHAFGFVHRDVKPENLFLLDRPGPPTIKLLDFGISKAVAEEGVSKLTGRLTLGTPRYMSPEQIRSTTMADHSSDLWSLGAVLYELLTGSVAFPGESVTELCAAVLELEPTPVRDLRPDVPVALCAVVSKCLEKDPANRWANVAELAQALLPFAPSRAVVSAERSSSCMRVGSALPPPESQEGAVSSVAGLSVEVRTPPATLTLPVALGARAPKRATRPWRGVAIVALAMVGVGAMAFFGSRRMATTAGAKEGAPPPTETPFRSAPATAVQFAERPAAPAVVETTPVSSAKTQGAGVHAERAAWVAPQGPRGQAAAKRGAAAPSASTLGSSVGNAAGSTSVTAPPSEASSDRPRVELGY